MMTKLLCTSIPPFVSNLFLLGDMDVLKSRSRQKVHSKANTSCVGGAYSKITETINLHW